MFDAVSLRIVAFQDTAVPSIEERVLKLVHTKFIWLMCHLFDFFFQ